MEPRWYEKDSPWIVISASLLLIDQAVKALVVAREPLVDWGFVRFVLVRNTGASFGILGGANALLIWVGVIAVGLFLYHYDRLPADGARWGLVAFAGVASNLVDRAFRGAVVDYVDLGWWPVFNIGDALIVVGALLVSYSLWREDSNEKGKGVKGRSKGR